MSFLLLLTLLAVFIPASLAQAATAPVLLETTDPFALLAGTTITNTGNSVINGELGLHPGSSVTGFPPGTVNGAQHISDAVALNAKSDLVNAYQDAAGRPLTATSPPDIGGQSLTSGVYRTGSVASLGLTGAVTLDGQGDPRAVFIFQIESTLVTATDSSVNLVNGAQACNVFWQVGSSATLGTRTSFRGNILALTSISVNDAVAVDGRLFARNGAVTLINDTVTRSSCAAGTGPGTGPGGGLTSPGPDTTGPGIQVSAPPAGSDDCTKRNFTTRVRVRDNAGIKSVKVYLDGELVRETRRTRFSLTVRVRDLSFGRHRITVVAYDRAGNRSVKRRSFGRCDLIVAVPQFAG
ncbi:MAG TPA: ice-binding family protein [Solirubrobacterales bacterium]|jgi:hypothetical protein|nr:ice-binding family protein [Solirubrobacterales bacterium]